MKILAIGTSGKNCTVAIFEDKNLIKEININDGLTHSQNLMPTIDTIFKETGLELSDIDYYACSIGPGSFTGIRIGIATIKGICLGCDKPVVAVPSLLALAYNIKEHYGYIISCIDAKNDNVYAAVYDNSKLGLPMQSGNYISDNIDELVDRMKSIEEKICVVGDGAKLLKEKIQEEGMLEDRISFCLPEDELEYASSIANAAYDMIQEGKITDGIHVSPLYLKKSQAERELEEKEKGESN